MDCLPKTNNDHLKRTSYSSLLGLSLLFLSIDCLSLTPNSNNWQISTQINSFNFSEPINIGPLVDEWDAELEEGNRAFSFNQAEVKLTYKNLSISVLRRFDYLLKFSNDTAIFYHSSENDIALEQDRIYHLNLDAFHIRASGIKFAANFDTPWIQGLSIEPGITLYRAQWLIDGYIRGQVSVDGSNNIEGDLEADYFYSEDELFDRPVDEGPIGSGYGLSLGLAYKISRWEFNLHFQDLISRIQWQDAPFTQAQVSTETRSLDEQDFVQFDPLLSGLESEKDFQQKLPVIAQAQIDYQWLYGIKTGADYFYYSDTDFLSIFLEYATQDEKKGVKLGYFYEENALHTKLYYNFISLDLKADDLSYEKANFFALSLGFQLSF